MQTEVCECDSVSINRPGEIRPDISFNSCNHIFGPGAFRSAADTALTIELVSSYFSLSMAHRGAQTHCLEPAEIVMCRLE